MSKIKLPHASGNSMSIAAPATNPSSDLELKLPATIGTAGQVLKNSGTAGTLEFAHGIEVDQWRLPAQISYSNPNSFTFTTWERNDTNFDKIGTGMSHSSGVFTFPSTGIWEVEYLYALYDAENTAWAGGSVDFSSDSGGSWAARAEGWSSVTPISSTNTYQVGSMSCILDIDNISTHRVRATFAANVDLTVIGHTNMNRTYVTFKRLGDT